MMRQPNFIVFLTDDQGYGDLSCMGATDFVTPHIDRLANEGARFTCWYSNSPVCSPSRAALLSGKYPGNAGVRSILAGHRAATGLPESTQTIATALKKLDYNTFLSGKWHLGLAESSRPHSHGFDRWYGHMAGCIDYFSHIFYWGANRGGPGQDPTHDLWEDNEETWQNGEYFTEMIVEKAIHYIREAAVTGKPFFLYVPFNAPHYPMHAPKKYMDRFAHLPWDRQVMAAMISAVDDGVGSIMAELERQGIHENTCTVFTSDNGPSRETRNWLDGTQDPYYGGKAGRFKGHKFSLFEGGVREPGIMHWPDRIPGGQILDTPVASMDVFPTLLTAAGGNVDAYDLDGMNLLPYVADGVSLSERDIFWEQGKQTAVRRGPWKLVMNGQLVEDESATDPVWLSNLDEDIGEQINMKDARPDVTEPLTQVAESWRAEIEKRWERDFA
ncbi:MAG: sulfatase-like hydrolase/transferase, partial [Candidatus Latescibacteria bacterium]|nr:sulfatase-like hydrolase/transferase [Candidatus Latescibacterota bacterium]